MKKKKFVDKDIEDIIDSIRNLEEVTQAIAKILAEANDIPLDDSFCIKTKSGEIIIPVDILIKIEDCLGHRLDFMGLT